MQLESPSVLPIDARPSGIYFAPKIKYHAAAQVWVLWVNYLYQPETYGFSRSQYLTATSASARGPFAVKRTNATVGQLPGGDFDLFVSGDDAYLIYTSHLTTPPPNHLMSVERLTPDWLDSTRVTSGFFGASFVESPVMFERKGTFYALFDHCCCFCGGGSGAVVHTAPHPLGPWTNGSQIGAYDNGSSVPMAQQRSVLWHEDTLVWQGQRWQSAPDRVKDHDFATWLPLEFDDGEPPRLKNMTWRSSWTLGGERTSLA